jgi:precorrin-6A/cobalt-precorrin-6A reductase
MMGRLWLIGGTQESRQLVTQLMATAPAAIAPNLLVSVTTAAAQSLYPDLSPAQIWVGQLTPEQADAFLSTHTIVAILDMSHPFATAISTLAIALAKHHNLSYLRYERSPTEALPTAQWLDLKGRPGNLILPELAPVLTSEYLTEERSLLTLGYRWLPQFAPWQTRAVLFARILPSPTALVEAQSAGFTPDRLVALRPPLSPELEIALWQQWGITQVITKASGQAGGEAQKLAIAAAASIRLLRIARPAISYPRQTESLAEALAFALTILSKPS